MGERLSTLQTQLLALWREIPIAQRMTLAVAAIGWRGSFLIIGVLQALATLLVFLLLH